MINNDIMATFDKERDVVWFTANGASSALSPAETYEFIKALYAALGHFDHGGAVVVEATEEDVIVDKKPVSTRKRRAGDDGTE